MKRLLSPTPTIGMVLQKRCDATKTGIQQRFARVLGGLVKLERVMQRLHGQLHVFAVNQNGDLDL